MKICGFFLETLLIVSTITSLPNFDSATTSIYEKNSNYRKSKQRNHLPRGKTRSRKHSKASGKQRNTNRATRRSLRQSHFFVGLLQNKVANYREKP